MKGHTKIVIMLIAAGIIVITAYRFVAPFFEESAQKQTSDARNIKAKILIGTDNWIGYFPLCSTHLRKSMRRNGYDLRCQDDQADYPKRMQALARGDLQFAVATVDAYLSNGSAVNFPATIVAVIDESKGGDAIVAWRKKITNIDALKKQTDYRIALTPNSPSEHLLRSMAVHFDIPLLQPKSGAWRIASNGSEDALKRLLNKQADIAVLWEPDVSKALHQQGIIKILGTEDTDKLIVDVLLVNRSFARKNPQIVTALLKSYFRTVKYYRENPQTLSGDIAKLSKLDHQKIQTMLNGVNWKNLTDNSLSWFGVAKNFGRQNQQGLVDVIESTVSLLVDLGDFNQNPIPDHDPYRLINSRFISELYQSSVVTQFGQTRKSHSPQDTHGLARDFKPLNVNQWRALREIGTLKIRPIVFQSGTFELSDEGREQMKQAVEHLKHYPNFRVLVKGHTGTRGDADANLRLSEHRAKAVASFLHKQYGIDTDRIRPQGFGAKQPLPKRTGESERAYQYRLPRVELFLVAEDI